MQTQQSFEELSAFVAEMKDRHEIWQCLLRYSRGVDRFDTDLILSAYHPDAIDDHGKFVGSPVEFVAWAKGQHTHAHLGHTHNLFNHVVEIDGDVANAETYFMFAGMNKVGQPLVLNGGRYLDRLEKRDGEWRIAYRTVVRDWGLMDERPDPDAQSSYTSTRQHLHPEVAAFMDQCPPARRDTTDPSYARPYAVGEGRLDSYAALLASLGGHR